MSKRSNEIAQPQLETTKRTRSQNENEVNIEDEQKLQAARAALDRLDYKNASEICKGVSHPGKVGELLSGLLILDKLVC